MVVAMTAFMPSDDVADVLLPIAPFTETSGTFVNTEGRAQSFNGSVKPMGEARPGWKVLRVLGNLLGVAGFDYESSEAIRAEVTGGATDLMARCGDHDVPFVGRATSHGTKPVSGGLERIADVPIYFADTLVRRSPPLQATHDAEPPKARLNGRAMVAAGLASGDMVRVSMDGGTCTLACEQDETVADGCIRIATAHPSTARLPATFGVVTIEKIVEAPAAPSTEAVRA